MISDVMADAVREIDRYFTDPVFADTYGGELRKRIIRCRNEMEMIRSVLDTPPNSTYYSNPHLMNENQSERPPGAPF